jgi:hypothetical protein
VWTLVTPYCKRTRLGRGTNTKTAGFPPLSRPSPATSLPTFALGLAPTHLGWGTRRHFTRRLRDPPVSKRRHNQTVIAKVTSSKDNGKSSRHVKRHLKSVRKLRNSGVISVTYISTDKNLAGPFTKVLSRSVIEICRCFETGGSLDRRVKCRRVPQPRWVDARRSTKGEKGSRSERERGGNPAAFVFVPRPGRGRLQ